MTLDEKHFRIIAETVRQRCGINLRSGKKELIKSRLLKRLRVLNLASFDEYIRFLKNDATGAELTTMIDCLTTNKTNFHREPAHFEFMVRTILPGLAARRLRIWSAGCSTGEEPYTIAVHLREYLPDPDRWDAKILATDVSTRVLAKARIGRYPESALEDLPPMLAARHFITPAVEGERLREVAPEARRLVSFAQLNLMGDWPMQGPFDIIFCRNVMIYFEKPIQERLIKRFRLLLAVGGHLFVGHSESLAGIEHGFTYVQPATYQRRE